MNNFVKHAPRLMSILTMVIALLAWLAISNHCVLGAAAPETKPAHNECPFHSTPATPAKQKQSNDSPCCKILRALLVTSAKALANTFVDTDLAFAKLIVLAPPKIFFASATLDTGPPGTTSFVELTGSMLAHAPPVVV